MSSVARRIRLPKTSFFLVGPRGTGKSTWLREMLPRAHVVDLLDEGRYQSYLASPSVFAAELRAVARGSWVVVDEIQRLPALLNDVHRAIEAQGLRFALSGSSARKLRRGGVNLLGGRAHRLTMFPFTPAELGSGFDLERALRDGTVPLVWSSEDASATLLAYTQTYLKEEIQAEALVRNLPGFARFLPIAALFHGQVLNISTLARDAGVSRTTVTGYIDILEDTLIATRLPAFEGRLRVRERKHPKLYVFDPGVTRALKRQRGPVTVEERGALLEGLVHTLLRFHHERDDLCDAIACWSPAEAQKTEVDFVLTRGREHIAIEVKSSAQVRPEDLAGLRAIEDLRGLSRRVLVHTGARRSKLEDGIEAWPFDDFCEALDAGKL